MMNQGLRLHAGYSNWHVRLWLCLVGGGGGGGVGTRWLASMGVVSLLRAPRYGAARCRTSMWRFGEKGRAVTHTDAAVVEVRRSAGPGVRGLPVHRDRRRQRTASPVSSTGGQSSAEIISRNPEPPARRQFLGANSCGSNSEVAHLRAVGEVGVREVRQPA